ncbi:MAG: hypothetical protein AAF203_04380 [Pseudomonadota bacterium]
MKILLSLTLLFPLVAQARLITSFDPVAAKKNLRTWARLRNRQTVDWRRDIKTMRLRFPGRDNKAFIDQYAKKLKKYPIKMRFLVSNRSIQVIANGHILGHFDEFDAFKNHYRFNGVFISGDERNLKRLVREMTKAYEKRFTSQRMPSFFMNEAQAFSVDNSGRSRFNECASGSEFRHIGSFYDTCAYHSWRSTVGMSLFKRTASPTDHTLGPPWVSTTAETCGDVEFTS